MTAPTRRFWISTGLLVALSAAAPAPLFPGKDQPVGLQEPDKAWARKTVKSLSLREKVGQLVKIRVMGRFLNRRSAEYREIEDQIRRNQVGGVVLFAGNVYESAVLLNDLQQLSRLPLIVAADFERGASFRIADTTSFPWTMGLGAAGSDELAYQQGAITGRESRAMGVHWVYAPVMDVNNNPDNPVINIRAFGEDPELVGRLGAAFIRGCRDNGVLTTAKHFPGHGDTATDSHIGLAVVPADRARLDAVELVPFRSAIRAGVDSVMTAHVAVPQFTGEPEIPATLSPRVMSELLRNDLGFQGLLVTDALEMGGITTRYWGGKAAILALQAGADMLLLPPQTDVAINEVVRAVERGDLSEAIVDRAVERVLLNKTRVGLHEQRTVDIERIASIVSDPDNQKLAQRMADRSLTLVRNENGVLPIHPLRPPKLFSVVLTSDLDPSPGANFQSELRRRFPGVGTAAVDLRTPPDLITGVVNRAAEADVIICATIVRVVSSRGTVALPENLSSVVDRLLALNKPVVWVAFGNPYLLRLYPRVSAYLCTFSYADVSQISAAKAVAGEIPIGGRMPVSIPQQAAVGHGLQVPALDLTLRRPGAERNGPDGQVWREVAKRVESYIARKAFPGAAVAVGHQGTLVLEAGVGRLDYERDSAAVTAGTVYDLASLSKAVGTSTAAMLLVERGHLLLEAPLQDYLPEFRGAGKEKVRVLHLLQHTSGLPAYLPLYRDVRGHEAMIARVASLPLESEPGARTQYSDLGMILLGETLSRAAGMPLDRFLHRELFEPLGMKSTTYVPAKSWLPRIAPTEVDAWRKRLVRGEVHDENAFAMGGVAGHAGLFGSARDLSVFAQMLLNGGMYDHRRYLRPDTIARFTNAPAGQEGARGLGWAKPAGANWTGRLFSRSAFGHTGFTGTSIWIDPERQLFLILLSNRVHPSRENTLIDEVRRVFAESVLQALGGTTPARAGRR